MKLELAEDVQHHLPREAQQAIDDRSNTESQRNEPKGINGVLEGSV